jgi:hypothetical protein
MEIRTAGADIGGNAGATRRVGSAGFGVDGGDSHYPAVATRPWQTLRAIWQVSPIDRIPTYHERYVRRGKSQPECNCPPKRPLRGRGSPIADDLRRGSKDGYSPGPSDRCVRYSQQVHPHPLNARQPVRSTIRRTGRLLTPSMPVRAPPSLPGHRTRRAASC